MIDYHPLADVMRSDPLPVYERLRAQSPVHYVEDLDAWALALFDDVWEASQNPDLYPSPGPSFLSAEPEDPDQLSTAASIFALNPPLHTELRTSLIHLFSPAGVRKLEPEIRGWVRDCIQRGRERGSLDVIADLGLYVSVRVACSLIGLPLADADSLSGIVRRYFSREPGVEGMSPDAHAAAAELQAYLLDAVREKRRSGDERRDALSVYASFRPDGAPLNDDDFAQHLNILVVGGTETLPKVAGGGVIQLARHPDQRADLAEDPSLIRDAFSEIARYEMPTHFLTRRIARDHELRGQKLKAGQSVLFLYRCANRDEREFDRPDRFDVHRRPPRILAFGHGTHVCLGQQVARLEGRVILEELLAAFPDYAIEESEIVPERSEFVAGYVSVPIHFDPS